MPVLVRVLYAAAQYTQGSRKRQNENFAGVWGPQTGGSRASVPYEALPCRIMQPDMSYVGPFTGHPPAAVVPRFFDALIR